MPRPLTLDEIVEESHAGEDPGNIILFPPDDGVVTDENSGDENEANILHLPSRMLRSQVEVDKDKMIYLRKYGYYKQVDELEEEIDEPVPKQKKMKKENTIEKWNSNVGTTFISCGKGDCDEDVFTNTQEELSAVQCFELLYFDFRRNVATIYLQKYGKPPTRSSACGVPLNITVPAEVRTSGSADDHSQIDCSQRRCGYCHQRTRKMCGKCNIVKKVLVQVSQKISDLFLSYNLI